MKSPLLDKKVFAWALYDWANSAFATTVMVVFFPVFFKQYWAAAWTPTDSTFWLASPTAVELRAGDYWRRGSARSPIAAARMCGFSRRSPRSA